MARMTAAQLATHHESVGRDIQLAEELAARPAAVAAAHTAQAERAVARDGRVTARTERA